MAAHLFAITRVGSVCLQQAYPKSDIRRTHRFLRANNGGVQIPRRSGETFRSNITAFAHYGQRLPRTASQRCYRKGLGGMSTSPHSSVRTGFRGRLLRNTGLRLNSPRSFRCRRRARRLCTGWAGPGPLRGQNAGGHFGYSQRYSDRCRRPCSICGGFFCKLREKLLVTFLLALSVCL